MVAVPRWAVMGSMFLIAAGTCSLILQHQSPLTTAPPTSFIPTDLERTYKGLVEQAHSEIAQNHLKQAILHLESIPVNSKNFATAQQLKEEVARVLLERATDKFEKGDLPTALSMARVVPLSSISYSQAKKLKEDWEAQNDLLKTAHAKMVQGQWREGLKYLEGLKDSPVYQSSAVQTLVQVANSHLGQKAVQGGSAISMIPLAPETASDAEVPSGTSRTIAHALSVEPRRRSTDSIKPPRSFSVKTGRVASIPTDPKPASESTVAIATKSDTEPRSQSAIVASSAINNSTPDRTVVLNVGDILGLTGLETNPYMVEAETPSKTPLDQVAHTAVAALILPSDITAMLEAKTAQVPVASMTVENTTESKMGSAASLEDFTQPLANGAPEKQNETITAEVLKAVTQITAWYSNPKSSQSTQKEDM